MKKMILIISLLALNSTYISCRENKKPVSPEEAIENADDAIEEAAEETADGVKTTGEAVDKKINEVKVD